MGMINASQILNLENLDLLTIGIAIAAIGILGFIAYFTDTKSVTNKTFLWFAFFTMVYGIFNYASYKTDSPFLVLWLLRFTIVAAVWHAFSFFQLFYVFPHSTVEFGKQYKRILVPLVILSSILNLTPLAFPRIVQLGVSGQSSRAETGPAMALFGGLAAFLVIGGIVKLFQKTKKAKNRIKEQFELILIGTVLTFSLLLTFNLILPVIFNNVSYIPLAPLFILPFIVFTTYAIIKFQFLNIKIIATEIFTFFLALGTLFEVLISRELSVTILRFIIFCMVLVFSILLNRTVRKEVKQKEELQVLTKQLADANQLFKTLDKARTEFLSIASHQLRTPPATIKWYLSSILHGDYGTLSPEIQTALIKTEQTNNLLISLIEDLLNVSRIERGTLEFLFEPVDFKEMARITYEQLFPLAKEKGLELIFDAPKSPIPQLMADKEKLRQVINNLIDNAIKYTQAGKITVSLFARSGKVFLKVKDTGKGISKEESKEMFQKFRRGKESFHQSAGLGLGLYVAKVIVTEHKGEIWAESDGEGKGSTFIISLPINSGLAASGKANVDFTKIKAP